MSENKRPESMERITNFALAKAFIDEQVAEIRAQVGDKKVLLALSGGTRIGVTLTETMLMLPQKSVSAVLGIADTPQPARVRGCAHCTLNQTCPYRKAGATCHV